MLSPDKRPIVTTVLPLRFGRLDLRPLHFVGIKEETPVFGRDEASVGLETEGLVAPVVGEFPHVLERGFEGRDQGTLEAVEADVVGAGDEDGFGRGEWLVFGADAAFKVFLGHVVVVCTGDGLNFAIMNTFTGMSCRLGILDFSWFLCSRRRKWW